MSNYTKITDFAVKDGLPGGDPGKKVRGSEIDAEFEAIETAVATKADASSAALSGTPTAPTAVASNNSTQIATTAHVKTAIALAFQGMIVLWSGSQGSIPSGWVLCDGNNGSPDLRDRFIVGAGNSYAVGNAAGSITKATDAQGAHSHSNNTGSTSLTTAQLPAHSHKMVSAEGNAGFNGSDVTASSYINVVGRGSSNNESYSLQAPATGSLPALGNTGETGTGGGHTHTISGDGTHTHNVDVRPPYYALCYIMKT